jgi:hypothetical protein
LQLGSHSQALGAALLPRPGVSQQSLIAGFLIFVFGSSLIRVGKELWLRRLGYGILWSVIAYSVGCVFVSSMGRGWFLGGCLMGLLVGSYQENAFKIHQYGLAALILAWGVSISEGWPFPTLAGAGLVAILLGTMVQPSLAERCQIRAVVTRFLLVLVALSTMTMFHWARRNRIYDEAPATELKYELTGIFPGGNYIVTNRTTYEFLRDFQETIQWGLTTLGPDWKEVVLPELAQYWVSSKRSNLLSSDWPIDPELNHPETMSRVIEEIRKARGRSFFVVQKYYGEFLPKRLEPYRSGQSKTRDYVRDRFDKIHETPFFEIYK